MAENENKFKIGEKVRLTDGDERRLTVVAYSTDYLTMSLEAIENTLGSMPTQKLVTCEWTTLLGETKQEQFSESSLEAIDKRQ